MKIGRFLRSILPISRKQARAEVMMSLTDEELNRLVARSQNTEVYEAALAERQRRADSDAVRSARIRRGRQG